MRQMLIEELRDRLQAERIALQDGLAEDASAAATVQLDQTRQGRLSRMDAMQQQAMALAGQASCRRRIAEIDAALNRIEDGSFGVCEDCAESISQARLVAQPEVRLCISCKARNESQPQRPM